MKDIARRLRLVERWGGLTLLGFLLTVVVGLVAIGCAIAAVAIPLSITGCHQGARRNGTTGSYQFPTGCYYRLPDGLETPANEYPAKHIHIEGSLR